MDSNIVTVKCTVAGANKALRKSVAILKLLNNVYSTLMPMF